MKNLVIFLSTISALSLNGQQTGLVNFPEYGVAFSIPEGWTGQEYGPFYIMTSNEFEGLIAMVPHERSYSQDELLQEASSGFELAAGTYFKPMSFPAKEHQDRVIVEMEGMIEYNPVKAYAIGLTNIHGNGLTVLTAAPTQTYRRDLCRTLTEQVVERIEFSQIALTNEASKQVHSTSLEDWKYQLGGTKLTWMESYSSGGTSGGGYNMSSEIHLCQAGYFLYKDDSFMSAGGQNRTAVSASNSQGHGSWDIVMQNGQPQLILTFIDGSTKEFALEWGDEGKLFLNGYRYFRTWTGENAPDCND